MKIPDPTQYKLGDTIYIPTDSGTLELKCVRDAATDEKVWQFIELVASVA